jgi:hypothetical protein
MKEILVELEADLNDYNFIFHKSPGELVHEASIK